MEPVQCAWRIKLCTLCCACNTALHLQGWSMATEGQEQKGGRDQAVGGPAFTRRGLTAAVAAAVPVMLLRPQVCTSHCTAVLRGIELGPHVTRAGR